MENEQLNFKKMSNRMKIDIKQKQSLSLTKVVVVASSVSLVVVLAIVGFFKLATTDDAMAGDFCGEKITKEVTISENLVCKDDLKIEGGTLYVDAELTILGKIELKKDGKLIIRNHGTLKVEELKGEGKKSEIEVQPGGWLYIDEGEIEECSFINNGYVEHTGKDELKLKKLEVEGDGVFYITKSKEIKLEGNAKIFDNKKNKIGDDEFLLGSDVISVKRLPKFKVEVDGLELGDSLVIIDTLDLNGKNLDINKYDFRLPKSFAFHREGNISEYIKTGSTGRYNLKVLKNNKEHVAPIGRNPYLPVAVNCEDCQGTDFGVAVTQNVYLDPVAQSGLQVSAAVGETWSIIPTRDFTGEIFFELQWNAGANGTTSSELSSFDRATAVPYYWIVGESNQWVKDPANANVEVLGSDPYTIRVTLTGMMANKEYLFSIGSSGTALPVEFTYFNATEKNGTVELTWGTATEKNNDFFEVQRSDDGVNWVALEQVQGAGTTINPRDYVSYDQNPLQGLSYYRLKQVDFDGTTDYSKVREVRFEGNGNNTLSIQSVYPNPFQDQLSIDCNIPESGAVVLELLNASGVSVKRESFDLFSGNQQIRLDGLSALNTGYYILNIKQGSSSSTKKVIKK